MEIPASNKLMPSTGDASQAITLHEALGLYLRLKGYNKQKQFEVIATRHLQYLLECLPNRPIDLYSTADGSKFKDWLVDNWMQSDMGTKSARVCVCKWESKV